MAGRGTGGGVNLSFKCKTYGDRPHTPCSGTTDDGTGSMCNCRCHEVMI